MSIVLQETISWVKYHLAAHEHFLPSSFPSHDSLSSPYYNLLRGLILYPDTINIKENLQNPLTYILLQVTNPQKQLTNNYCMWKDSLKSGNHLKPLIVLFFLRKKLKVCQLM